MFSKKWNKKQQIKSMVYPKQNLWFSTKEKHLIPLIID
jgi:hypothetical protein